MDLLLPAPLPLLRAIQTTRFPFDFEINWRSVDKNVLTLPPLSRLSRVWMCSVSFALHPLWLFPDDRWPRARFPPSRTCSSGRGTREGPQVGPPTSLSVHLGNCTVFCCYLLLI